MVHHPYPWYYYANDALWLTLLVVALVFSFRANIPCKKTFSCLIGFMITFRFLGDGVLSLAAAVGLFPVSMHSLVTGNHDKAR